MEAFWYEDVGTESGDKETLYTDIVGFDTVCPTATPYATVTSYAFDQDVVMPAGGARECRARRLEITRKG